MLVEKFIIEPGTYWYRDEKTGLPRKLDVTPELTKYWHEQGSAMLSAGLTVPVPFEHDFNAHPMTPKDQLLNNAGEVKEYKLKGNALWSTVDIQDPDAERKIGKSIRWTSPWINSFTDGDGKNWRNVISHLALTTRPRIVKQVPFGGIAAALSIATPVEYQLDKETWKAFSGEKGFCLSKAGRLVERKKDKVLCPEFPMAFSLYAGGIKLAEDDPFAKKDDDSSDDSGGDSKPDKSDKSKSKSKKESSGGGDNPFKDQEGDIDEADASPPTPEKPTGAPEDSMPITELLAQLLPILGVQMPDARFLTSDTFMRELCTAMLAKVTELAGANQQPQNPQQPPPNTQQQPPGQGQPNPLIQQEQQPMYMSLEEINKIPDVIMKGIALSMYNENVKLRTEMDADRKKLNSLNDAKLKEEKDKRTTRVQLLSKLSPKVKADLDAMLALPSMALSMGEGGIVIDPMAPTLAVLEKGLSDLPRLLTTEHTALSLERHPTDEEMLSEEAADKISDQLARSMGCPPEQKKTA